jgi:hypothetical protein
MLEQATGCRFSIIGSSQRSALGGTREGAAEREVGTSEGVGGVGVCSLRLITAIIVIIITPTSME